MMKVAMKLPIATIAIQDGVFRTAYLGVVSIWLNGNKIHIAPELPWGGYKALPPPTTTRKTQ